METNDILVGELLAVRASTILCTDGGNCEYCEGDPR